MKTWLKTSIIAATICGATSALAAGEAELTGDPRIACEVILCLSDPKEAAKTKECHPPLRHFYSIRAKKWKDTLKKRKKFLELCPEADDETINNTVNVKQLFDDCDNNNNAAITFNHRKKDCKKPDEEEQAKNDESENSTDSDVKDTKDELVKKKRGYIVSGSIFQFHWAGEEKLEAGKTYTVVYYEDLGDGKSIKTTANLLLPEKHLGLTLTKSMLKRGAPILLYDGKTLIGAYNKNGDTGKVVSEDNNPDIREEDGSFWAY